MPIHSFSIVITTICHTPRRLAGMHSMHESLEPFLYYSLTLKVYYSFVLPLGADVATPRFRSSFCPHEGRCYTINTDSKLGVPQRYPDSRRSAAGAVRSCGKRLTWQNHRPTSGRILFAGHAALFLGEIKAESTRLIERQTNYMVA